MNSKQNNKVSVRAVNVHKTFENGGHILKGVNLEVNEGSICSIIGPSGAGKSTFLRSINQLETITDGKIYVDGELVGYEEIIDRNGNPRLKTLNEKQIATQRKKLGMVFQNFNLFPHKSVLANVTEALILVEKLSKTKANEIAKDMLSKVGLEDRIHFYPSQLSGGQKQRVAIARALASNPKIMLFDEPTSALDPELVNEVLDVIRALAKSGTTMIIVTHEIEFAKELSDQIVLMADGVIAEQGTVDEVFNHPKNPRTIEFLEHIN
jgi:polar amino acid transport system ATP-binding protein